MTTTTFVLHARPRHDGLGKGPSRRLRRTGAVPGILYGGGEEPRPVFFDVLPLEHQLGQEAFYSHLLEIREEGATVCQGVLKAVQRHPVTGRALHVDILRVRADRPLRMQVPIHFQGEAASPGVKEGGVFSRHMIEIEIQCLPKDLPEYLTVDVSGLGIGEAVHLSQIPLPEGVVIPDLEQGAEHDLPVASVHHARVSSAQDEEVGAGAPAAGETAAGTGEAAPTKGEAS
jgi:large subunit ribosomal protein L25